LGIGEYEILPHDTDMDLEISESDIPEVQNHQSKMPTTLRSIDPE
jgi:hypothetical protein